MPSIVLQKFSGLAPRISARLLAVGNATIALMTKLWSGELRPFGQPGLVTLPVGEELPTDGIVRTIYKLYDKWLAWTKDVDVVSGFTALASSGQIYWTGDGPPKQSNYSFLVGGPSTPSPSSAFPLGVVGPVTAPTVAVVGVGSGDPIFRSYVYTYYTIFNEESVPSPPSALVSVETGQTVDISGFDLTYGSTVKEIRIYRTVGGEYLFVTAISVFLLPTTYNDALLDTDLAEPLISQHFYPPPANLIGLIGLACGSLAGFYDNNVAFSEPYQPGAWPPEYVKIFDYPVIALATFGQTCVVATSGHTYLISGSDPRSFSVARVADPYPCVSKKSMVSTDNGCVYASNEGLIFVGNATITAGQASGVHVLTRQLITREEWLSYNPPTIIGVSYDGKYYGFYQKILPPTNILEPGAGFIYDFTGREETLMTGAITDEPDNTSDILIRLTTQATAVHSTPYIQAQLFFVTQQFPLMPPTYTNYLYRWEGSAVYNSYHWRSKQFSFPYALTFSAAKLYFNNAFPLDPSFTFRIYDGNGVTLLYERHVTTYTTFRLPSLGPRTDWFFEVEGSSAVQMIEVSTSYQDLQERKVA